MPANFHSHKLNFLKKYFYSNINFDKLNIYILYLLSNVLSLLTIKNLNPYFFIINN